MNMSWQDVVAVAVALLGLGAGAFLVVQRPSFWIEFGQRLGQALLPLAWRYVSKRMPPKEEAAWREAESRGQGDEWSKQRYRVRRKTQTRRRCKRLRPPPKLSPRASPASERGKVKTRRLHHRHKVAQHKNQTRRILSSITHPNVSIYMTTDTVRHQRF